VEATSDASSRSERTLSQCIHEAETGHEWSRPTLETREDGKPFGHAKPGAVVKRDLQIGIAQWLATPGGPKRNLQVALDMIDLAAARGVELLVLPELWPCGYDPATLADDARQAAEPP
jgi:hypothetical protein